MTNRIEHPKYDYAEERLLLSEFLAGRVPKDGWVKQFEREFAQFTDSKYAIAVNSATSGLHAALYAAGVGVGDKVISPALTVVMDAFVTAHLGAEPVFADVDLLTHNICPDDVATKYDESVKAVIGVSWQGLSCDVDKLRVAAPNALIIEDSAQSLHPEAQVNYQSGRADIRVYSFESKKHMSTGSEGGMVTTDDPILAEKVRKFAGIGYRHLTSDAGRTSLAKSDFQRPSYRRFDTIGLNYRMNEVSTCIGLAQLKRFTSIYELRQKVAGIFIDVINRYPNSLVLQSCACECENSYYTVAARLLDCTKWTQIHEHYVGLGADGFYAAVANPYLEPAFRDYADLYGWYEGMCPNAELLQKSVMSFKTNYRNIEHAIEDATLLDKTLSELLK